MRLLSHTNWRAFILLYYYYYWVGYARRGVVALICEFLLGTFPSRRLAATTAAALSHSHLPHFVARARACTFTFRAASRRGGLDHFCVNCLRCANDQSQRNKRYTRGCTMPIGCDNKTKQKQSKSKLKWKLNSNWNANPI